MSEKVSSSRKSAVILSPFEPWSTFIDDENILCRSGGLLDGLISSDKSLVSHLRSLVCQGTSRIFYSSSALPLLISHLRPVCNRMIWAAVVVGKGGDYEVTQGKTVGLFVGLLVVHGILVRLSLI